MRHALFATLPLILILNAATALATPQEHPPGMKHMRVVPNTPQPPPADAAPQKTETDPVEKPAALPERKPLAVKDAIVKLDDLKPWSRYAEIVSLSTPDALDKMVRVVEADPGSVPPQALLFLARGLADHGRMEDAAVYYYLAQLRLSFDVARWPPRMSPEDIKRMQADKNKTQDQSGQPAGGTSPKVRNPHDGVVILASAIGGPITEWMLKEPERADKVMARVSAWDQSATYAYLPNYALPQPTPFEEWAKMLPDIRANFYARMDQFISGLKKMKAK